MQLLTDNSLILGVQLVRCFSATKCNHSWLLKHHASLKNWLTDKV